MNKTKAKNHPIVQFFSLCIFALLPFMAYAAVQEPLQAENLLRTVLGLVVVISLIAFCSWGYRKIGGTGLPINSQLRVESVLSVGSKEKILVVRSDKRRLLLSVTPGKVDTMMVLDDAEEVESEEALISKQKTISKTNVHSLIGVLRPHRSKVSSNEVA